MFTRFGGLSDAHVRAQVARGERLRALLAQPQFSPLRLVDEVALALALREGVLDAIPIPAVATFREALPLWLDQHAGPLVGSIEATRRLDDPGRTALLVALRGLAEHHA